VSTKKKNTDRNAWPRTVAYTRAGVVKVLDDIERGELSSVDLEKLRNFCLFALKMMEQRGPEKWCDAKEGALIDEVVALRA
jgi:hypothetical protein